MKTTRHFLTMINLQAFVVVGLSMIAVYFCLLFELTVNMPTGLIGVAIVFPIVFSINAAYRRREEALSAYAAIKGHTVAMVFAHRDWIPNQDPDHEARMCFLAERLFVTLKSYFIDAKVHDQDRFDDVYEVFSDVSNSIETLRIAGVPANEVSRVNQYLRNVMIDFEKMRNILVYRTPTSLRAYSQVFLNTFPILFAPYFAYITEQHATYSGYFVAGLYGLVLVCLENVQERLENPYDGFGEDDIRFNTLDHYRHILPK
ncbi:MAG: hypothetical protein HN790_00365 [Methylococcales bacterium]|jgi:predicted membrane chloride channel (bestrophin family)|nr:hypothetical protein [Methylococcales bacterium]